MIRKLLTFCAVALASTSAWAADYPSGYTKCVQNTGATCTMSGTRTVALGKSDSFVYATKTGNFVCSSSGFPSNTFPTSAWCSYNKTTSTSSTSSSVASSSSSVASSASSVASSSSSLASSTAGNSRCVPGAVFTNETVDCGGKLLSLDCKGDSDGQPALITLKNASVKNVRFAEKGASKGIWCVSGTCNVEGVVFDEVCEDAMSARDASGITLNISGSVFKNKNIANTHPDAYVLGMKPDKFIQVNGDNTTVNIKNSEFHAVAVSSNGTDRTGKVARTCGNCSGQKGPRTITLDQVKIYGKLSTVVGINSTYRHNSNKDKAIITNLKIENWVNGASGTTSPKICEEFEGLDKNLHSGDSPSKGQFWNTASCVVKTTDVTKL